VSGAAIANVLPQDMYGDVLIIGATNVGLAAATVTPIGDGLGNDTPLEISQTRVNFNNVTGVWQIDGTTVTATAAQLNAAGGGSTASYVVLGVNAGLPNERVLTGTANEITITDNGAGLTVVLSLPTALTFTGKTVTGGTFASVTLTGPELGTPASGVLTNCTGYPSSSLSGVLGAALGGTGIANNAASTLTISGSFATTLTVTGVTGVTLPTTGTLATLAGAESLTNKTIGAATLSGTLSGGGNQVNNVIIGTTTPLAGAFTTLVAQSLATSAASPLLLTNGQLVTVALTSQTVGGATLTIPNFASVADEFVFKTKAVTLSNKTLGATTLAGTVSGGGQQINNVIIGTSTPLAGAFTTLVAQSLATSAASPLLMTNGQLVTVALTSQSVGATALTIPNFAGVADEFTFKTKSQTMSNKTFVAPELGTPASGNLGSCTNFPVAQVAAGTVGAVGFSATDFSAGTKSSGTYTPAPASGNFQYAVNGGAHTLAPPATSCTMIVQYTNNGSAGAVTTSGFTKVSGAFTTVNGDDFLCYLTRLNGFSSLNIVALQ
jgi:hypothetical protein